MAFLVCLFLFIVRTSSVCLGFCNFLSENGMLKPKLQRRTQSPNGWCVCCFEVQRNAPKMSSKNGRKQNEKAQKDKEQRGERLCKRLHRIANTCTLFLRGICKREFIIGERTPKRCRVIKEKIPSNLTVARYLFPVVSCGHFTSYRSHKYTLREKGVETGGLCLYICLRFPAVSLDFIGSWNKDFARIHLHRKEKNDN